MKKERERRRTHVPQLPLEHERIIEYLQSTTFINVRPIYTQRDILILYKGDG
jgi:hypothetical protein